MMVGSGFNFEKAEFYFTKIKDIIDHFNSVHRDIRLVYSTLFLFDRLINSQKEYPVMSEQEDNGDLIKYAVSGGDGDGK
jgi:hypothetical protein